MAVCIHPDEEGNIIYDRNHCLLEEDTWIDIRAEVTPEYQTGSPNANDTIYFSLYIDNSGPFGAEDVSFQIEKRNIGSLGTMKMYEYDISNSEKWFIDYDYALTLSYDEEAGQWRGNGMLAVTAGGPSSNSSGQ